MHVRNYGGSVKIVEDLKERNVWDGDGEADGSQSENISMATGWWPANKHKDYQELTQIAFAITKNWKIQEYFHPILSVQLPVKSMLPPQRLWYYSFSLCASSIISLFYVRHDISVCWTFIHVFYPTP